MNLPISISHRVYLPPSERVIMLLVLALIGWARASHMLGFYHEVCGVLVCVWARTLRGVMSISLSLSLCPPSLLILLYLSLSLSLSLSLACSFILLSLFFFS